MPAPRVIYQPKPGSPIDVDREFYGRLGRETEDRDLVEQFVVPIRSGRAWPVLAGQRCRIVVVTNPMDCSNVNIITSDIYAHSLPG